MESKGQDNAGGHFFPPAFATAIEQHAADQLERELLWVMAGPLGSPTDEQKRKARELRERIVSEGKLYEVLEATMPKPCPTCGQMPQ